ncbi:MAG: hypothetical protein AUI16_15965 [Alphaproteobacteria bacterium 13_2_20CM_2_64_7]|nr:MAG: hypothetical protein AUI16_15965 [Alphaproteobacteria bacterium 13_2_20CM_2_64_7]
MLLDVTKAAGTEGRNAVDFRPDLAAIRAMSAVLPGALPLAVNGVRVAASIRPRKFVIEGGDDTAVTMPRTAFQIVYPDCSVMIDSGLDKATHDSFSPDKPEPYFAEQFAKLQRALATPHRPHLKLAPQALERFIVLDYPQYYPVAPGVVLIQSPGHSPDSQMVFIRLQSGREILHSVDSAWIMDNIMEVKGKAAPWVKEDVPAVMAQLRWLKAVAETEKNITILVTHDDELFDRQTRNGTIGRELAI